ncbi:glycosyltransferase [Metabacillus litoralis]|uniref:Glycosyltransferase n=1 Tax=Metabacillus litoralis TaxID=152268 RepID=A0A5C6W103_9BACI|nr:glycosyltransferase [Metabacillus litoralis]TXC90945.1 glycosyltransferase [Metabacillus litoralis]
MDISSIENRLLFVQEKRRQLLESINDEKEMIKILDSGKKIDDFMNYVRTGTTDTISGYLEYRDEVADKTFFEDIKPILDQIPSSNGSRYYNKLNVNIGIVADEFLYSSYKDIANFIYINRENYKEYKGKLDLFIFASTWRGLDQNWEGVANLNSEKIRNDLFDILTYYKKDGVKTIFYSKEDPVNYERFIEIAQKCEYVFTTAKEVVSTYKKDCGHERVHVLEFGVNPFYHNPIGMKKFPKKKEVLFAGSWYRKYTHRQEETSTIFNGVIAGGKDLKIIDRNFNLNHPNYFFPKAYLPYISPSISHDYIQKLHKLYDWSINLNSVTFSETMFANRVFELQALGNLILSNYSVGINNKFPNVFIINNEEEVPYILNHYTEEELYKQQSYGIRRVMSSETTFDRLTSIMDLVDFKYEPIVRKIAVLAKEITPDLQREFDNQTYKDKFLFEENDFSEEMVNEYQMITFFNPEYSYHEFYLEDMINGFKYTDSDYITKDSYKDGNGYVEGAQHDFVREMKDKYRTVFWSSSFSYETLKDLNAPTVLENGYSVDPFEIVMRNQTNIIEDKLEYNLSVIVPVYNNGHHLFNKCFMSLRRSSMFDQMEIILVDDGSSDQDTLMYINRICRDYPNVKSYFFKDSGSGSASRARNKGFELSTAKYVTYLDPDNEAVNDGYSNLYEIIKEDKFDMVVGDIVRLDNEKKIKLPFHRVAMRFALGDVITEPKKFLVDSNLKAQSIQALIVHRDIIGKNNIKMVMNAAGQDTLFFHELMLNSSSIKTIDLDIHIYYAAVTGSVTNTISKRFFEKYLVLEHYRIPFLEEQGLMDAYIQKRFNYYFKHWYMKRVTRINEEELEAAIDKLYEIFNLYKNQPRLFDDVIDKFDKLYQKRDYKGIVNLVKEKI